MTDPVGGSVGLVAPGLPRRLACLLYEAVLLFGVIMFAGLLYGVVTQQRHALVGSTGLKLVLVAVLAAYFVYFWTRSGQTLAMLTWHIKLVTVSGQPLSPARALCRFALSWIWILPALATAHFAGLKGGWPVTGALLTGALTYAALTRLHPDRQYWHDALCGTRLISWRRTAPSPAKTSLHDQA